jgi:hypothetical protein
MKHALAIISIILASFAAACSDDSEPFDDCSLGLGERSGIWRTSYTETDGTCGPIPDETTVVGHDPSEGCTITYEAFSEDRCRGETSFTCLSTDPTRIYMLSEGEEPPLNVSQSWTVVLNQVSATKLTGTGTVQLESPRGTCRSTYAITVTQL